MHTSRRYPPLAIWGALIGLTMTSFAVFEGHFLESLSTLLIVSIAAIKSRLVIVHFMEATHAPGRWRLVYETWNFGVSAMIVIGHYVTLARLA